MKVFKFGGASVKDSSGVKNLKKILLLFGNEPITVVISAMGKTTNSMEKILDAWLQHSDELPILLNQLTQYHLDIIHELNIPQSDISDHIDPLLEQLKAILTENPLNIMIMNMIELFHLENIFPQPLSPVSNREG